MIKLPLLLLAILLITACQKEITTTKAQEEIATANKQTKTVVCHYDAVKDIYMSVTVTDPKGLAAHLNHGDTQGDCSTIQTVTICDQVWMVKNLDVTTYRNGDLVTHAETPEEWQAAGMAGIGAWCYYENNKANGRIYGKLYNWYAVDDPRGLAPQGWHVPSVGELYGTLSTCLGGYTVAGGKMKSVGTIEDGTGLWYFPNRDATNSSGFTALPGGTREGALFFNLGRTTKFWSSDYYWNIVDPYSLAYAAALIGNSPYLGGPQFDSKARGFSVRCVKD